MGKIEKTLLEMHALLGSIKTNVDTLSKVIHGNGQPGLAHRFEVMHEQHQQCREQHKAEAAKHEKIFDRKLAVFTAIAAIAVPLCWELLKKLI
jgi:hypothetical protein